MARGRTIPLSADERRDLHRRGIESFNAGRYFEAHEAWETIWRSPDPDPADLYQGLIQVAVAMYHLHVRGRTETALKVLARARSRLAARPARDEGLDVDRLRADLAAWEGWLLGTTDSSPPRPTLHHS